LPKLKKQDFCVALPEGKVLSFKKFKKKNVSVLQLVTFRQNLGKWVENT